MAEEYGIGTFESASAWRRWLSEHHGSIKGIWVRIAKKDAAMKTVTYDQALDEALCHGWIDGQKKSHDEASFLQKFTPRRPRSLWSKRNVEKVAKLLEAGKIKAPGLAEIEAAKKDGRWAGAYDSSKSMTIPEDFLAALKKNKTAEKTFKTLNRANLFAIGFRLQTARTPETRQRRIEALMERLKSGLTIL
ncbi:MAG: bacteriocin-protection protein YdeI/OmpD-associated family [Fibrobacteres bacterium]|nr:bacteriocin-protection protein YdeI/OmpD-associated family [Fibrobacterota bacterium]